MKLIETPLKIIIVRWDTGDGEVYIEITVTETGLELYCDGEGMAELSYDKDCINSMIITPELCI